MQLTHLSLIAILSLSAMSAAQAATTDPVPPQAQQLPASEPVKPKHTYGAVAIGITNAENFGHHWSAVGISSRGADTDDAMKNALSKCNSKAHKLRLEDGCLIVDTWNSVERPKACNFAMPVKVQNRAFTIIRTSANEVWRACKEVGALFCKPKNIVGGCTQ